MHEVEKTLICIYTCSEVVNNYIIAMVTCSTKPFLQIKEIRKTVHDSESGVRKMAIGHHIGKCTMIHSLHYHNNYYSFAVLYVHVHGLGSYTV